MSGILEKWAEHAQDAGTIEEFLEWCGTQGWLLSEANKDDILMPVTLSTLNIIHLYFDIDSIELDKARRKILLRD